MDSILGVIGNTPSIWLDRLCAAKGVEGRILAKLDYLNPGFSKKDRAALGIIRAATADGTLKPGQTVVELTSGNMGTGLAIVCGQMGHPFVAVMSRGNSPERARMMRALGAEVVLVDQAPGSRVGEVSGADLALVEADAQAITAARGAFRADQFNHPGNAAAHEATTGPELWADSGQTLTAFADFAGSGGSYGGTIAALKRLNPGLRGYVVEPEGAAALAGQAVRDAAHPIQGGGYAMEDLTQMRGELSKRRARRHADGNRIRPREAFQRREHRIHRLRLHRNQHYIRLVAFRRRGKMANAMFFKQRQHRRAR